MFILVAGITYSLFSCFIRC